MFIKFGNKPSIISFCFINLYIKNIKKVLFFKFLFITNIYYICAMKKIIFIIIIIAFVNNAFTQTANYINQHFDSICKYEKNISDISPNLLVVENNMTKTQFMFKNNICYRYIVIFQNDELYNTFTKTYTVKQNAYPISNISVKYKQNAIIYEIKN